MDGQAASTRASLSEQVNFPNYIFRGQDTRTSIFSVPCLDVKSPVANDFYRSAKWCSDGSAILAITESRKAQILNKEDLLNPHLASLNRHVPGFQQPSAIWSHAWYPYASLNNPSTFCYVLGIGDAPVRLIDGIDGRIRASYAIIDHTERFVAPSSMAFNRDASRLYCGTNAAIEVFDFTRPGATSSSLRTTPSRKSKDGQKGLISALAFSSDGSGTFAAGSYSGTISIYSEDTGEDRLAEVNPGEYSNGVTQLAYHPLNPNVLFSASRMSNHVAAYDLRNLNAGPFVRFIRPGYTQQRLLFDIDWTGRFLMTGATDGVLRAFDIDSSWTTETIWQSQPHSDSISSVSMHPIDPLVVSTYGTRTRAQTSCIPEDTDSGSDTDSPSCPVESSNGSLTHMQTGLRIGVTTLT